MSDWSFEHSAVPQPVLTAAWAASQDKTVHRLHWEYDASHDWRPVAKWQVREAVGEEAWATTPPTEFAAELWQGDITGRNPGQQYTYAIRAVYEGARLGEWSEPLGLSEKLPAVDEVWLVRTYRNSNRIRVGWKELSGAAGYKVTCQRADEPDITNSPTAAESEFSGLAPDEQVSVSVFGWFETLEGTGDGPSYMHPEPFDTSFRVGSTPAIQMLVKKDNGGVYFGITGHPDATGFTIEKLSGMSVVDTTTVWANHDDPTKSKASYLDESGRVGDVYRVGAIYGNNRCSDWSDSMTA